METRFDNGGHRNVIFTDEKIFTRRSHNRQNNRVWLKEIPAAEERVIKHCQHPLQVMIFLACTFNGKMAPVFLDPEYSFNGAYYRQKILREKVRPWAEWFFGDEQWTYQQDGAPSHTAYLTQDWLRRNTPDFIRKEEWLETINRIVDAFPRRIEACIAVERKHFE